jgi:hypothetical protein
MRRISVILSCLCRTLLTTWPPPLGGGSLICVLGRENGGYVYGACSGPCAAQGTRGWRHTLLLGRPRPTCPCALGALHRPLSRRPSCKCLSNLPCMHGHASARAAHVVAPPPTAHVRACGGAATAAPVWGWVSCARHDGGSAVRPSHCVCLGGRVGATGGCVLH